MSYPDSVRYLYSLGNELRVGAKWGLERMLILLGALGHPEQGCRFIHVAGTNGKGSTCAALANVLVQAGYNTGLYTSPHLVAPTERIQVNGQPVTEDEFADAFKKVHCAAEDLLRQGRLDAHPSYFETVTAMALLIFQERCDISVVETGLGGRLDATNVIMPELCVITPIAFDHEAYLGNTIEAIAGEKAGILKPNIPVVLARQSPAAEAVIVRRAEEVGAKIIRTTDACATEVKVTAYRSTFNSNGQAYTCNLAGRHQLENALSALLAARELGLPVSPIQAGLANLKWPGRLEYISYAPDVVLDGAHNPAGATSLAAYIKEFCLGRPVWLVYGAMRDKAIEEVTELLFPLADHLIVTAPEFSRALRPQAILQVTAHPNVSIAENVAAAIKMAHTAPAEAIIFFTGSLFLVGEARGLLLSTTAAFRRISTL